MKKLCGFACLIISVLVGGMLVAPLGAEAGTPTLTLDGQTIALEQESVSGGDNCPAASVHRAYNGSNNNQPLVVNADGTSPNGISGCYSITGLKSSDSATMTVGQWTLGNFGPGNRGRVLVNDGMGSDYMKVSGLTITATNATTGSATATQITSSTLQGPDGTACTGPTPPGPCRVGVLTLNNIFNASGGQNNTGSFSWGMSVDGSIDLNGTENAANDRFRIIGSGCELVGCTITTRAQAPATGNGTGGRQVGDGKFYRGGTKGFATVPPVERSQGAALGVVTSTSTTTDPYITANNGLPVMDAACNSGNSKCTPTLRMDYVFWLQGKDKIKMGDSVNSCSGSCNPLEAVTTPKHKAILKCGDPNEVGTFVYLCTQQIKTASETEKNLCPGCEEPAMCDGTCIIITMNGTPPGQSADKEFNFEPVTGQGVGNFQLKLNSAGYDEHTFSNLQADTVVTPDPSIDRFFTITTYPNNKNNVPYQTDQILCTSRLNDSTGQQVTIWEVGVDGGNSSTKLNLTVFTLGEGDILACNWHVH